MLLNMWCRRMPPVTDTFKESTSATITLPLLLPLLPLLLLPVASGLKPASISSSEMLASAPLDAACPTDGAIDGATDGGVGGIAVS